MPTNQQADLDGRSYQGGYIRGHQCMSNHRYVQASSEMNAQTFYSTNIMPQNSTFNSGLWGSMEQVCTAQACSDTLYCVTGNWGTRGYATDQNGKRIAAPEYCFKVILRTRSGRTGKRIDQITDASQLKAIGYWAANASSSNSGNLRDYTVSVSEIERKTGFKVLPDARRKDRRAGQGAEQPLGFRNQLIKPYMKNCFYRHFRSADAGLLRPEALQSGLLQPGEPLRHDQRSREARRRVHARGPQEVEYSQV